MSDWRLWRLNGSVPEPRHLPTTLTHIYFKADRVVMQQFDIQYQIQSVVVFGVGHKRKRDRSSSFGWGVFAIWNISIKPIFQSDSWALCPTSALCLNVRAGDYYTAAIHTRKRERALIPLYLNGWKENHSSLYKRRRRRSKGYIKYK